MLSTNPFPAINDAAPLRDTLRRTYPDRAIVIRSLNDVADKATIVALRRAGFQMLPARMVYIADQSRAGRINNNIKHDRRLLRKARYQFVADNAFTDVDYAAAERLYAQLYLDKYTPLNPQYTAQYMREMHKQKLFSMMGLRDEFGRLVAVTGLFENAATLTQPIVGYGTDLPQSHGLYRMIMALGQKYAMDHDLFFHMTAGAGLFKRRRGAVPIVLFRTEAGVSALMDRCPHRFVELSKGRVVDGEIECPYHGWRFNHAGSCTAIPGHVSDPPRSRVKTWFIHETDGAVFVSDKLQTTAPYVHCATYDDVITRLVRSETKSTVLDAAENILDATHTHFTHKGLLRGLG